MSVAFPELDSQGKSLVTKKDSAKTKVNYERHNDQIDTLERRDLFLLDFLSKFDALPIGAIMPTSIPYSSDTMPDGWVWANGGVYGKTENDPNPRPNLWNAIKNIPNAVVPLRSDDATNLNTYQKMTGQNTPNGYTAFGKYVDMGNNTFCVPTLNDVYLRSITADNNTGWSNGQYELDSIGEHTHDIKAYPVNGANLNTTKPIGVALTDEITETFSTTTDTHYKKNSGTYTSENNNSAATETKPKTIAYQYMIKADFTSFDLANATETDCASVAGYKPSITPPVEGNLGERIFPVSDPDTGKISSDWFDTSGLAVQVLDAASDQIVNVVNDNALLRSESLIDWADPTSEPKNKIPMANDDGKIDSRFLKTVTTEQIESLFSI